MKTTICYVVSPSWRHYLYASISSLLESGTYFDEIEVFSVGGEIEFVKKMESAKLKVVEPRSGDFLGNKTYLTKASGDRVVFLDADTLVLNDISKVYDNVEKNLIAKEASFFGSSEMDMEKWNSLFEDKGIKKGIYFNSGFLIFQNKSHKKLKNVWFEEYEKLKNKKMLVESLHGQGKEEQIALSLSVKKCGITTETMGDEDHVFGWIDPVVSSKEYRKCNVYHTGSNRFWRYSTNLHREGVTDIVSGPNVRGICRERIRVKAIEIAYKMKYEIIGLG